MGIETILLVVGFVIVLAVVVGAVKGKRKVETHTNPPDTEGRPPGTRT